MLRSCCFKKKYSVYILKKTQINHFIKKSSKPEILISLKNQIKILTKSIINGR